MRIAAGSRLGPYEIVSPLGAGGMGEVWRARDTRLDRSVAVKILPEQFVQDAQLRARFQREARAISSLNHPNICSLYDVGDGYLVMELMEGESLAVRIARGPLPVADVLRYGSEIADALDHAHRAGIIHRDLKPGNVVITKTGAKLLDFGLAAFSPSGAFSAGIDAATMPRERDEPLTSDGTILGTLQYMSPEQLNASNVDARSDIFALGVILYEMATGGRPFEASTRASVIASILEHDPPPMSSKVQLSARVPLERLVRTCLAKNPDERFQSAHDVGLELTWIAESSVADLVPGRPSGTSRLRLAAAIATLVALIATAAVVVQRSRKPPLFALSIAPPRDCKFFGQEAISPDGSTIAFAAADQIGDEWIWLRRLNDAEPKRMARMARSGRTVVFWSPDGKSIGWVDGNARLMRVATDGGEPEKITDSVATTMWMGGVAWTSGNSLLYGSPGASGLLRVNTGGPATVVTRVPKDRDELVHANPVMLPGGTRFLYVAYVTGEARNRIYAAALVDSRPQLVTEADAVVGYTKPYLLFVRDGAIYAQRFDPVRGALSGEPRRVIEGVRYREPDAEAFASVSDNGVVEYLPYRPSAARFEVYDRSGSVIRRLWLEPDLWEDAEASEARLYTTGSMLLVNENQPSKGAADVVSIDLARGISTRLTGGTSSNRNGIWSPDGHSIAFSSDRAAYYDVYVKAADPDAPVRAVWKSGFDKHVSDWSPDGNYLLVAVDQPRTGRDIWVLPLNGNEKPWPLAQSEATESQAQFSPDGRWVAYASDETGSFEVFVRPFRGGRSIRVSTAGGRVPTWSADGKELLFSTASGQVMLAGIGVNGSTIEAGVPKTLFSNPRMWQPARLMRDGNIVIGERASETADLLNVTTAWRAKAP